MRLHIYAINYISKLTPNKHFYRSGWAGKETEVDPLKAMIAMNVIVKWQVNV